MPPRRGALMRVHDGKVEDGEPVFLLNRARQVGREIRREGIAVHIVRRVPDLDHQLPVRHVRHPRIGPGLVDQMQGHGAEGEAAGRRGDRELGRRRR